MSTFSVSLPVPTHPDARGPSRQTILLVEGQPDDEALTLRALRRGGIRGQIVVKHDGEAALEYPLEPP